MPEKAETSMDEEISRKSEPPQEPDFDPPDGHTYPVARSEPEPEEPADFEVKPGSVERRAAIEKLRLGYHKTGLSSLHDEESLAALVDAWRLAALSAYVEHEHTARERVMRMLDEIVPHADSGPPDVAPPRRPTRCVACHHFVTMHKDYSGRCTAFTEEAPCQCEAFVEHDVLRRKHTVLPCIETSCDAWDEPAVRLALGAHVAETTLEAATRVANELAARGCDTERLQSAHDSGYSWGVVEGLQRAFDIMTGSEHGEVGRLKAWEWIREAREQARKVARKGHHREEAEVRGHVRRST